MGTYNPVLYSTKTSRGFKFTTLKYGDISAAQRLGNAHLLIDGFCWGCHTFMPNTEIPCVSRNIIASLTFGDRENQSQIKKLYDSNCMTPKQNKVINLASSLAEIPYNDNILYLTKKNSRFRELNDRIVFDLLLCKTRWETSSSMRVRKYYLMKDFDVLKFMAHMHYFNSVARGRRQSILDEVEEFTKNKVPSYVTSSIYPCYSLHTTSINRGVFQIRPMQFRYGDFFDHFKQRANDKLTDMVARRGLPLSLIESMKGECHSLADNRGDTIDVLTYANTTDSITLKGEGDE